MATFGGYPACKLLIGKDGTPLDPTVGATLAAMVDDHDVTDLVVLAHGWNNDMNDAQALYDELLTNMRVRQAAVPAAAGRRIGVLATFWPSKKFADDSVIPGGAAGLGDGPEGDLRQALQRLKGAFDDPAADARLEQAEGLVARLENDPAARTQFATLLRSITPASADEADSAEAFFTRDASGLIDDLSTSGADDLDEVIDPEAGGVASIAGLDAGLADDTGSAQGLGDLFQGTVAGALNLLNTSTYYQMKDRAGKVGATGVNPLLSQLRASRPALKVHLVGHSFGGRVVAAAAHAASNGVGVVAHSLTLLQAAFSHYGFSDNWEPGKAGFFRNVVAAPARIAGPVVITCTDNDTAVGRAYAIASRLAGQVASALGDKNDKFGGIGRNGAQKTPNTKELTLLAGDQPYPPLAAGTVYNMRTATLIRSHGDVRNPAVANVVLAAIAST